MFKESASECSLHNSYTACRLWYVAKLLLIALQYNRFTNSNQNCAPLHGYTCRKLNFKDDNTSHSQDLRNELRSGSGHQGRLTTHEALKQQRIRARIGRPISKNTIVLHSTYARSSYLRRIWNSYEALKATIHY